MPFARPTVFMSVMPFGVFPMTDHETPLSALRYGGDDSGAAGSERRKPLKSEQAAVRWSRREKHGALDHARLDVLKGAGTTYGGSQDRGTMNSEPLSLAPLPLRPMLGLAARCARRLIEPHEHWVGTRATSGFAIGLAEAIAAGERVRVFEIDEALRRAKARTTAQGNAPIAQALLRLGAVVGAAGKPLLALLASGGGSASAMGELQRNTARNLDKWFAETFTGLAPNEHRFWDWALAACRADRENLPQAGYRAWSADDPGPVVEALSPQWLGELWPRKLATPDERALLDAELQDGTAFTRYRRVVEGAGIADSLPHISQFDIVYWFIANEEDTPPALKTIASLRKAWRGEPGRQPQLVAYVKGGGAAAAAQLSSAGAIAHLGPALGLPAPDSAQEVRYRLENSALNARAGLVGRPGGWLLGDVRVAWRDPALVAATEAAQKNSAIAPPRSELRPVAPFSAEAGSNIAVVTRREDRAVFAAMRKQR